MKLSSLLLFLGLLVSQFAVAQHELKVNVRPQPVAVGQAFEISWSISTNASDFQTPDFSPFRVVAGPMQGTNMSFSYGQATVEVSVAFHLVAVSEGTFTIPPASIRTREGVVKSKPVTITVVKGSGNVPPGNRQQQQQQQIASNVNAGEDLFLRATVNKKTAYPGEPVNLVFKVYTRLDLRNVMPRKMPSLTGFWAEDYDMNQEAEFYTEVIDGVQYRVADLKRMVLFPQKTGELTIDPIEMDFTVIRQINSRNPWEQIFGNYQREQVTVKSLPLKINVKPLPGPKPESFNGAVGNYTINSSLDRSELKANEAVKFTITISGTGNLSLIQSPEIKFPPDIEVYDPESKSKLQASARGMNGSRSWEYLLIPRHKGTFTIPEYTFSYFDTSEGKYKTLSTGSFELSVSEGEVEAGGAYSGGTVQENIKTLEKDIRHIHREAELDKDKIQVTGTLLHAGAVAVPFLAFFLFLFFRDKADAKALDSDFRNAKRAGKMSASRLALAEKLLKENKKTAFLDEAFRVLYEYISHRFTIPVGELNKEKIESVFEQYQVSEGTRTEYLQVLEETEFARFSPAGTGDMEKLLNRAKHVISEVERELS